MVRKKVKPIKKTRKLSEEHKEKLRTRLAEMRAKKKPAEYKNIAKSVLALPDDDTYSFKNVKGWIAENKLQVPALSQQSKSRGGTPKDKQTAENLAHSKKVYIRYCEYYLKTGDWISMFSGKEEEHKVVPRVVAMAYNADGTPKRNVGFWYPDIKMVWTKEMNVAPIKAVRKLQAITDKQFTAKL